MPIYIGDYLRDTMGLTAQEHGCYLLLMMHYWTEKCLTDNIDELLIITRLNEKSRSVLEKILSRYFQHDGSCFRQKRIEKELKRREQQSAAGSICSEAKTAAARRNARKGGRPKKEPNGKPNENPSPQSQSQSQSNSHPDKDPAAAGYSPPRPDKAQKKLPDPLGTEAKECVDYYFERHVDVRGYKPTIVAKRDMELFKRLLRNYDVAAVKEIIDIFFGWKQRSDFTTGTLFKRADVLYGVLKDKAEGRR